MEEKVYCLDNECPFVWCSHHPLLMAPLLRLPEYRDTQFKSPEYFTDDCRLRIRKWVEEMLD